MKLRLSRKVLAASAACLIYTTGCTARLAPEAGFPVYADIKPTHRYSYALPDNAPARLKALLGLSLAYWNQALGDQYLLSAPSPEAADVKIIYSTVETVNTHPAHTDLLGCMQGYRAVADCTIVLELPRHLESAEDIAKVAHLFKQGPLDAALYQGTHYADAGAYLADKLILLSLIHEIGHSFGLAHADDAGCVMAAVPNGDLNFCGREIAAAKVQLLGISSH